MTVCLDELFSRLLKAYGPQAWWPADTPFEVMVGAVLVQNTAWKNVRRAIDQLREAGRLSPQAIHASPQQELETLIRPAGYYRVKAKRLRHLVDFLVNSYDGSVEAMRATPPDRLRAALLGVHGVGPETADSILLYAAELPSFVVDTYTHRVLVRHGWIEQDADYHAIKEFFESRLEPDVALYNEFHALLVRVGHLHCRKNPSCDACPLVDLLPEGGICLAD
ncbi:MAG: endonuclease III domain-containing protein [Pirellulales bacterium]